MIPYYNNTGGYPNGYPPQTYGYNPYNNMGITDQRMAEAYQSPNSPFIYMNPPVPPLESLPTSPLENIRIDSNGYVIDGPTEDGPIPYTSVSTLLQQANNQYAQQQGYQSQYGYNQNPYYQQPQQYNNYQQQYPYGNMNMQTSQFAPNQQQQDFYVQPGFGGQQMQQQPMYNIGGMGYCGNNQYNVNPYGNASYTNYYYQLGQYDRMVASEEYSNVLNSFDPFECLRDAVLTDEEKRLSRLHQPTVYNYNGYYQSGYSPEQQQAYDKIMRETKEKVVDFWTNLSIAAHRGSGETDIDEEAIRCMYDPELRAQKMAATQKPVMQMTEKDIEKQREYARVEHTWVLGMMFRDMDYAWDGYLNLLAKGYDRVKTSHDRVLGLQPEDMNLKNYFINGGLLVANAMAREGRLMAHTGTNKYKQSAYKERLGANNQPHKPGAGPYDKINCDDDYVPMETKFKKRLADAVNATFKTLRVDENGVAQVVAPSFSKPLTFQKPPVKNDSGGSCYDDAARERFMACAKTGRKMP